MERFLQETWQVVALSAPFLLLGFALAGAVHVLLPTRQVERWLGRGGLGGVMRAALVGLPLPLCSCSVVPVATALRKHGASRGATVSFLISTPETGMDSIAVTYALLDPVMAVFRPIAALFTAVAGGLMVEWLGGRGRPKTPRATGCSNAEDPGGTSGSLEVGRRPSRAGEALRFGFVEIPRDIFTALLAGFVLSGLIAALLPEDFFTRHVGNELLAMLLMLLVGLPLYVCASASTPVAAAMILKGLSPGAALVFLLAGPATNVTTMLAVRQQLGWRALAAYVGSIAALSVTMGLLLNGVYLAWLGGRWTMAMGRAGETPLAGWLTGLFVAALAVILAAAGGHKVRSAWVQRANRHRGE